MSKNGEENWFMGKIEGKKKFCVNVQGEVKFHFITTVITSYNIVDQKLFPVIIS